MGWGLDWFLTGGGTSYHDPCSFFSERIFYLEQPVVSARLYATALGLYEFEINGKRVGEDVFTPGWTDYSKRIQYQVYDVIELLAARPECDWGNIRRWMVLWLCRMAAIGSAAATGQKSSANLKLLYINGVKLSDSSNSSWKTTFGPILQSDLLMGESYDAPAYFSRLEQA